MEPMPFAGFNPRPSPWGYSWTTENVSFQPTPKQQPPAMNQSNGPKHAPVTNNYVSPPDTPPNQFVNMPAALISSLKREKKPFTYTPGGVNLSEVLNARLQKRIERKKKSSLGHMSPETNERTASPESLPKFDPPKQVIVMPTYNTPLDMYSMENAIEALEVQAELAVSDKSLSAPSRSATLPRNHTFRFDDKDYDPGRNVTQSKAFKVLQIITDTEEELPVNDRGSNAPFHDEMRFTGIRDKAIPSKFFHNLQKITGTEEDENVKADAQPVQMERKGILKSSAYDKHQTQSRPGFLPQEKPSPVAQVSPKNVKQPHSVSQFQPMNKPNPNFMEQQRNNSMLRRPASFLPAKTGNPISCVKPVHPAFLVNGGPRRVYNPSMGTDF